MPNVGIQHTPQQTNLKKTQLAKIIAVTKRLPAALKKYVIEPSCAALLNRCVVGLYFGIDSRDK